MMTKETRYAKADVANSTHQSVQRKEQDFCVRRDPSQPTHPGPRRAKQKTKTKTKTKKKKKKERKFNKEKGRAVGLLHAPSPV
jgi:hypothetical protein